MSQQKIKIGLKWGGNKCVHWQRIFVKEVELKVLPVRNKFQP